MSKQQINVAIVGLGFGAEFIPIYQRHPGANMYAICPNARQSANWTCVGLCAHQSALKGGSIVKLPEFTIA